ncbi:ATP-binding protein [Gryllotalpicola ginsengisoli]|uniref:ATP-binding protein n=1 Tax=Gryllotalpicola ginsengisoli TaxID=444608 RepID=UPI0003B52C8D|nr:ATP-binding protein [Gryllotalpicola ginsengisoli]
MTSMPARPLPPQRLPLVRPRDCVLGGVSVAVARHLGWSVSATRWVFAGLGFVGGAGVLMYLWLWATVPVEEATDAASDAPVRHRIPLRWLVVGLSLLAAIWLLLAWGGSGGVVAGLLFTLAVLVAAAAVFAPVGVRLWHELITERTKRVREEERAEMAAHLHDSVLQTLALIQNRAGPSSEVARIARAQERELREWLYAGTGSADADLATDLKDYATALELDYPVRVELVAVGTTAERSSGELAAACREAMLNAARHAGGEVSVYIEGSVSAVDVFIRDRGPGFDPARVPEDRLGVRESIIGRMRRAGGSATVRRGAGGVGTEVHLHFEPGRKEES